MDSSTTAVDRRRAHLAFVAVLLRPAGEHAQTVEPAADAPSGADDPAPRQGLWSR